MSNTNKDYLKIVADSVGGGGWGPIVASTLIAKGRSPRYTIGCD